METPEYEEIIESRKPIAPVANSADNIVVDYADSGYDY